MGYIYSNAAVSHSSVIFSQSKVEREGGGQFRYAVLPRAVRQICASTARQEVQCRTVSVGWVYATFSNYGGTTMYALVSGSGKEGEGMLYLF